MKLSTQLMIGWCLGSALIAFGVHGCGQGADSYGWAVFAGLCLLFAGPVKS